jgi:UMF1 family MFS transporter
LGSLVFYNSYLPDIAYPEQQDSISAKDIHWIYWELSLLVINLIMKPKLLESQELMEKQP